MYDSEHTTDIALARLAQAIYRGTGCRFTAKEVQCFSVETFGEWAHDAAQRLKDAEL